MDYPKMIIFLEAPFQKIVSISRGVSESSDFVITSSDYFIRKPNYILFHIALQKAGLHANEVWYCGDNPQADIEGSSQVGIIITH